MANLKEIQRTERIEFLVSKEEKELIWKYAETVGMKPSRLIRNIVLLQAESKLRGIEDLAIKAYRKYLEITDPKYLSELSEAEKGKEYSTIHTSEELNILAIRNTKSVCLGRSFKIVWQRKK